MTNKKIYVLDTSVYLSDFRSLYAYSRHDIVIPLTVLEEVDNNKKRQDGAGANARAFIRVLDQLRDKGKNNLNNGGVRIRKGQGLVFVRPLRDDFELPFEFDRDHPDNQIIGVALQQKALHPDREVILVSCDINMRLKCDGVGLKSENFTVNQVIKKRSELYSGFKEIVVDDQVVDAFYADSNVILNELFPEKLPEVYPNEFLMLISSSNPKKTALCRVSYVKEPLKKIKTYKKSFCGFEAKNKEQEFAMDLLMDPEIPVVSLIGKAGSGKAQPLDAKVLTPCGWKTMGEIEVGDKVISQQGKPTSVLGVFPQGKKDIYKVYFTDGSVTECCKEHLWKTKTSLERDQKKEGKVRSLEEIKETLIYAKSKKKNHSIPIVEPIEFEVKQVELDPYLLGALLGDGSFRHRRTSFSTADIEILEKITPLIEKEGCIIEKNKSRKYDYNIIQKREDRKPGFYNNAIKRKIDDLGLGEKRSEEKFIPKDYLFSSIEDRIALLQGLMDTDGTVSKTGATTSFTTTSKQLSLDFQFLVQSLGGTARTTERHTFYIYKGEKKQGKISYRTYVVLPNNIAPFALERKQKRVVERTKYLPRRYIEKIEYVGEKEAKCILVDDPQHLYITDECIVTHNTLTAIAAGIEQLMDPHKGKEEKPYTRLIVSRPVQPMGRDLGFLPGDLKEKMAPWLSPVLDNLRFLFGNDEDTLDDYMDRNIIEVEALTYIRGRSIQKAFIIIDECQNLTRHEIKTILTRVGHNSKIVLTGDIEQIDNTSLDETSNGLTYLIEKFKDEDIAGHITLLKGERSKVATISALKL